MNNSFFIVKNAYKFMFPSLESARVGYQIIGSGAQTEFHAQTTKKAWVTYHKEKLVIGFSQPDEPIFVISKEDIYWNVICGEQIGWIIVDGKTNFALLEKELTP